MAMSENSNIPDPELMWVDGAAWLYFMVWNDVDIAEGVTSQRISGLVSTTTPTRTKDPFTTMHV